MTQCCVLRTCKFSTRNTLYLELCKNNKNWQQRWIGRADDALLKLCFLASSPSYQLSVEPLWRLVECRIPVFLRLGYDCLSLSCFFILLSPFGLSTLLSSYICYHIFIEISCGWDGATIPPVFGLPLDSSTQQLARARRRRGKVTPAATGHNRGQDGEGWRRWRGQGLPAAAGPLRSVCGGPGWFWSLLVW
jgi:hypothetical protein